MFTSYEQVLKEGLRGRKSRKQKNNLYLQQREYDDRVFLRYYKTDILTFFPEFVLYDCGGYRTRSTREHVSAYGPGRVFTENKKWFIYPATIIDGWKWATLYEDGMLVGYDGKVIYDPLEVP